MCCSNLCTVSVLRNMCEDAMRPGSLQFCSCHILANSAAGMVLMQSLISCAEHTPSMFHGLADTPQYTICCI